MRVHLCLFAAFLPSYVVAAPVVTAIQVQPEAVSLVGPRDARQLIVTALCADGSRFDATLQAKFTPAQADLLTADNGYVRGIVDGNTQLTIEAAGQRKTVAVTIAGMSTRPIVSFRNEVIAAFNVGGCNMGACHGTPTGKNGFRLSLRGFDPAQDHLQLTRDVMGRRTTGANPLQSLLLLKGMGRVSHEGAARFSSDGLPVAIISEWLTQGMADDTTRAPKLLRIEVTPGNRVLNSPEKTQQLAVMAEFADGSKRDVTRLSVFNTSDEGTANVTAFGRVDFKQGGEVAILVRYLEEMQSVRLTYLEPKEGFTWSNPPETNFVDTKTFAQLKRMSIQPSELCTDAEFVRRVSLDICGRLPSPEMVRTFLADKRADKRNHLIDDMLASPEYADFWALKWSDVFRSNRKSMAFKGATAFRLWMRDRLAENRSFDAIVQELLTATGNTHAVPAANYYRVSKDPQTLAETTAQLFLGVRMQCAKCHNHPFERWTQDDYYSTAAWFARVSVKKDVLSLKGKPNPDLPEVVFAARDGEVTQPRTGKRMAPKYPGGAIPTLELGDDRRAVFAKWLTTRDNPFFAKSVVNRVWFHLHGRGIVEPVDDFRESNPSCNDPLLDALAADFAAHGYDLKHLVRTIVQSRTYQLSAEPNPFNKDDGKYFSHAQVKLLSAEQLLDAVCDVTDVPEKFSGLPAGTRAIQLPDGEVNHPFLKTFGQPARELACECERESDSNLAQALQLINGPTINEKLRNDRNRLTQLLNGKRSEKEILDEIYLIAFARLPTESERVPVQTHLAKRTDDPRKAWEDVIWAVLNTREFLFRH